MRCMAIADCRLTAYSGWDEGVPTMSLGEKAVLTIPGCVQAASLASLSWRGIYVN